MKSTLSDEVHTTPKRPHRRSQWMEVLLRRCENCVLTDSEYIW